METGRGEGPPGSESRKGGVQRLEPRQPGFQGAGLSPRGGAQPSAWSRLWAPILLQPSEYGSKFRRGWRQMDSGAVSLVSFPPQIMSQLHPYSVFWKIPPSTSRSLGSRLHPRPPGGGYFDGFIPCPPPD